MTTWMPGKGFQYVHDAFGHHLRTPLPLLSVRRVSSPRVVGNDKHTCYFWALSACQFRHKKKPLWEETREAYTIPLTQATIKVSLFSRNGLFSE